MPRRPLQPAVVDTLAEIGFRRQQQIYSGVKGSYWPKSSSSATRSVPANNSRWLRTNILPKMGAPVFVSPVSLPLFAPHGLFEAKVCSGFLIGVHLWLKIR
jgi:hypothetical protein